MEARDRQQHQHFVHYYLKLHLENKLNTALGTIQNDHWRQSALNSAGAL